MKEMLTVRLHQITEPRGAESGPDVTSRLRLSIVPRENLLLAASIAELCEMMKAAHWCFSGGKKKEAVHTYFTDPFLLVSPLFLLDWMVMKDVYWWMTTAPAEWHPESHALLKNVSSACVFAFLSHVTDWAPRRTCHAWSRALHEMTRDSKKA